MTHGDPQVIDRWLRTERYQRHVARKRRERAEFIAVMVAALALAAVLAVANGWRP
jgi:hypothetical protein